mgnify:CR=1
IDWDRRGKREREGENPGILKRERGREIDWDRRGKREREGENPGI